VAVPREIIQVQLLVWIFVMRIIMIIASGASYLINDAITRARYAAATRMNFEAPLTNLVWLTSIVSVGLTYLVSRVLIRSSGRHALVEALHRHHLRHPGGRHHPRARQGVHLDRVGSRARDRHLRPRRRRLARHPLGLVAGNFGAYWLGMTMVALMAIAYGVSLSGLAALMAAAPVFAFGLVAFGFLGMGPVTIAVDSYGPSPTTPSRCSSCP